MTNTNKYFSWFSYILLIFYCRNTFAFQRVPRLTQRNFCPFKSTDVSNIDISQREFNPRAKEWLSKNNWPLGLQKLFYANAVKVPIRFMIIDDSGSMNKDVLYMNTYRFEQLS